MCRNCQKSKRECLGYDPIFKQQSGPAQIQPAPNSASTPHTTSASSAPAPPSSSTYSQSPVPQGYAPASSSGYATAAPATSGEHQAGNFHAIDPALAQSDPGLQSNQPYNNGVHAMEPAMRAPPGAHSYQPPPPPEPLKGMYRPLFSNPIRDREYLCRQDLRCLHAIRLARCQLSCTTVCFTY
jgi:hypothetical protein